MDEGILRELEKVTAEERRILDGQNQVDGAIYHSPGQMDPTVVDAKKFLDAGKLISIRKHTRFVHFAEHTHNYVEVIYMCRGSTHHLINGANVILNEGELLFLNQNTRQEIYPAGKDDIAVNFIILPEFFDYALRMMDEEESPLRDFVIGCLRGENQAASYLHFKVAEILPIQNLVENLIWTLMNPQPNKRSINQVTMGLLLLLLINYVDSIETDAIEEGQKLVMTVLRYIDENYKEGELSKLAGELHYDLYWLSKEIRRRTGHTYTELLQMKRLSQAAYLLSHTAMPVSDIALAVGYENVSYFHRIFQKKYGTTPRKYRVGEKE